MEILNEIWHNILFPVLTTAITAIFGYIGIRLKQLYEKHVQDKTKREEAMRCVLAVEQIYKTLHGPEKYVQCVNALSGMLLEKGIEVSEFEIRILIESALAELNRVFDEAVESPETHEIGFSTENPAENPAETLAELTVDYPA